MFVVDVCVTLHNHICEWKSKLNVKLDLPDPKVWQCALPPTFNLGDILRNDLNVKLKRNKESEDPSDGCFLPIPDRARILAFNNIVVFCVL